MGFMRPMVAMIFIILFGYQDHKNASLFLEYLGSLKEEERGKNGPCLCRSYVTGHAWVGGLGGKAVHASRGWGAAGQ